MVALLRCGGFCGHRAMGAAVIFVSVVLLGLVSVSFASEDELKDVTSTDADVGAHYRDNLELEAALKNFTQRCRHISRLYTIGNSTLGVPLWALEISDKPGVFEPEPAFKYVGNMHGDEPLGRELVLLLADWLCDNYLKDPMASLIVDKIHLHLLPSMNPDGFAAQNGPTRNNAHDVDLNRDFPDQFFPQNNNEEKRQAETRAMMSWIRSTRFTASASFHEGALVANYPWDGNPDISQKYATSPDDSTFKYLAGVYANNHPVMSKSKEFVGGVTNGAAWYPLYGGMQDWNYLHGNCLDLTLEMNDQKWPHPTQIPRIWSEHRKSLLELVAATVKSGVHGRVMSSQKAQPLPASISISGISHSMNASAEFGDYHRLLAPGQVYEVTASMVGYSSRSTFIFLPNHTAITLDFILDPLPTAAVEEEKKTPLTQAPGEKAETKTPVTKPGKTPPLTTEETGSVEVVFRKPTKSLRNGLHSIDEEGGLGSSLPLRLIYLLPLVSVAAVLVCLFLASRGSYRYNTARQRLSRV
ncbi:hypothetical protein M758_5G050600 [Ceratodon purpureus]|nr:hypothetical protein M758_5G050600 [Ceratodon purpureus]